MASTFTLTLQRLLILAGIFRIVLLVYGAYHDINILPKYTDIDYNVFTDAAKLVINAQSPYLRDTYRYTPLLAWILLPTAWTVSCPTSSVWACHLVNLALFSWGKLVFVGADLLVGGLVYRILTKNYGLAASRAALYTASVWLLNPFVAVISTRGNAESLLAALLTLMIYTLICQKWYVAGSLLGLSIHMKIYPIIYVPAILLWITFHPQFNRSFDRKSIRSLTLALINHATLQLSLSAILTFSFLLLSMLAIYGTPFVTHSYYYHLIRSDHRHNFSPYNTLLYITSASDYASASDELFSLAKLTFLPQFILCFIAIPIALAPRSLVSCMLAQSFAFVTYNKVCTSQYFLWYLHLVPFHLPFSSFISKPYKGLVALTLWIGCQALWLHFAYQLEFLGRPVFFPHLWISSLLFFAVNNYILSIFITDVLRSPVQWLTETHIPPSLHQSHQIHKSVQLTETVPL